MYWYNERTNVGTLAAALSIEGHHALEEFRTTKSHSHKKLWVGRADLYFISGRTQYLAEAKHIWVPISRRSKERTWLRNINKALTIARKDAVASRDSEDVRLGIVFVVPYISKGDIKHEDELVDRFLSSLGSIDFGFCATAFPDQNNDLIDSRGQKYPGVALLGRVPRR